MVTKSDLHNDDSKARSKRVAQSRGNNLGQENVTRRDSSPEEDKFLKELCYSTENEENDSHAHKPHPWRGFLHLLISPKLGWRKIKAAHYSPEEFARIVFYPLLALLAACRFIDKIYKTDVGTGLLLQKAIALFVAGFGGYYLVCLLGRAFLPVVARTKIDSSFGRIFVMAVMCVLTISVIVCEVLPWLGMMLMILPIYSAYILVKGLAPLRVPEQERTPTSVLMISLCFGVPAAIYYMLTFLMPPA
jgi:hypothetical protein